MRAKWIALLLLSCAAAHAHSDGHGQPISGVGPSGGLLAAVVRATEADQGEKAATRAIAEWKVSRGSVEVRLWQGDKKTPIALAEGAQLMWILAGGTLANAVVLRANAPKEAALTQAFTELDLARAGVVELIFASPGPSLDSKTEKHVTAFALKRVRHQ